MNRKGIKVISRYWMLNFLWFNISKPLGFKFPNHLRLLAAGLLKRMIIIQVTKLRYSLAALLCLFIEYEDWLAIFRTVISSVLIKTNWVDVKLINKTNIMVSSMSSILLSCSARGIENVLKILSSSIFRQFFISLRSLSGFYSLICILILIFMYMSTWRTPIDYSEYPDRVASRQMALFLASR